MNLVTLDKQQCKELFELAQAKGCILMEAIKTAHNTFSRLVLLAKAEKLEMLYPLMLPAQV